MRCLSQLVKGDTTNHVSDQNSEPEPDANPQNQLTGVGLEHWGDAFPSTRWSIVLDQGAGALPSTERMLERLGSRYWYPLYAFLRKRGHSSHDAQDLTQGFFSTMLKRGARGHRQGAWPLPILSPRGDGSLPL